MKQTLLEIVQSILSDLNSDEVNSIGDTVESLQVANIVKNTYFALMANRNWAHLRKGITLEATALVARPTHMQLPEGVKELEFINYNKQRTGETRLRYEEIKYISPDAFLRKNNQLNSDLDYVTVVEDPSGVLLLIRNDTLPQFYTTFDDNNIVFDSYDKAEDHTLVSSKVQAMAYVTPEFEMTDSHVPDLPAEAFPLLINECQSVASYRLDQSPDQKAEQESARQSVWLARKNRRVDNKIHYPNYGRTSRK